MDYNKMTITAEQMDWDQYQIAACMDMEPNQCIPSSQTTGLYGVRWSQTEGIKETVLADVVPLNSGIVFVAMSETGKAIPKLVNEVATTLKYMGVNLESEGEVEVNDGR